jgi:hypothetical protein
MPARRLISAMDLVPANPPLPPAEAAHASELVLAATRPQARKRADGASNLIALKFDTKGPDC